jgi:hypothetical protein
MARRLTAANTSGIALRHRPALENLIVNDPLRCCWPNNGKCRGPAVVRYGDNDRLILPEGLFEAHRRHLDGSKCGMGASPTAYGPTLQVPYANSEAVNQTAELLTG